MLQNTKLLCIGLLSWDNYISYCNVRLTVNTWVGGDRGNPLFQHQLLYPCHPVLLGVQGNHQNPALGGVGWLASSLQSLKSVDPVTMGLLHPMDFLMGITALVFLDGMIKLGSRQDSTVGYDTGLSSCPIVRILRLQFFC